MVESMTNLKPDREVAVVCSACPDDLPPVATVRWHSIDPVHTTQVEAVSGLAATLSNVSGKNNYNFKCDRDCPNARNSTMMTGDELRQRAATAWAQRHGSFGVLQI
jgi:hypothetical protein